MQEYSTKLISFYKDKKRMPSYSEMMILFGFKSKNAVYRVVTKLIDAGVVVKDTLGKLIPTAHFNEIPLVGLVKAGLPAEGDTINDTLNIESYLIKKREKSFLLTVDGDSMIDAHIEDGDIVVVERTEQAKVGDIVVAQVDGEFTMKYLRKDGARLWLEPANKKYKPIYPEYELTIVGVVKGVMRTY